MIVRKLTVIMWLICCLTLLCLLSVSDATEFPLKRPTSLSVEETQDNKKVKIDSASIEELAKKLQNLQIMKDHLKHRDTVVYTAALGHGGEYRNVQPVVSSRELIESDHAPNYSTLDYLENVPNLPDELNKLVAERRALTDQLATTKYYDNVAEIDNINKQIKEFEKATNLGNLQLLYKLTILKVNTQ